MRSSFEGMEGMEGMTGLAGTGFSPGGQGVYPDRVDLPFVTVDVPEGSPPVYKPIADNRCWVNSFPTGNWTSDWYALVVLTEFAQLKDWYGFSLLPPWAQDATDPKKADWNSAAARLVVDGELKNLVTAARDERPDALGEILAQSNEFVGYFLNLLCIPNSYPNTARLLRIASCVAGFCAIYYKNLYARPRPSMICPALLPPVAVPGHASFPSGHSTQAHLVARVASSLLSGRADMDRMPENLLALADRIARNREIAGLHFTSDTVAGVQLAIGVAGLLTGLQTAGGPYQTAYDAAHAEWNP